MITAPAVADATEMQPQRLLRSWLRRRLDAAAWEWLDRSVADVAAAQQAQRPMMLAFSLVPRRVGRHPLDLSEGELTAAATARPGWDPRGAGVDEAARHLLLLAVPPKGLAPLLERLFPAADLSETIALYRGLPLYPEAQAHVARAEEGARSNIKPVFEAVALRNPYPTEHFSESAWNHLVLKALFVGSRLADVYDIDRRCNPSLCRMLCDYAHERWAARRPISPELWRCVGPVADSGAIDDLSRVLATGDERERMAAALALSACPRPDAARHLATVPDLVGAIAAGRLRWNILDDHVPVEPSPGNADKD